VVRQLLFAEGPGDLGGVVGRPRSMWRDRAALRPVLNPHWRGGVGMGGVVRAVRNGVPFVTVPTPLLYPLCLAMLNTSIPFVGLIPATLTL